MREYEITADGKVAISPNAKYCIANQKGKVFEAFLNALFDARIRDVSKSDSQREITFLIGGRLHGLNKFSIEKKSPQLHAKRQKESNNFDSPIGIEFKCRANSGKEAYSNGTIISLDWFIANSPAIAKAAVKSVEKKFTDISVRKNIKIALYDMHGVDQFSTLIPDLYNSMNPNFTLSIYVQEWEALWAKKKSQFTKDLAMLIHYFEKGRLTVSNAILSGNISELKEFGLDKVGLSIFEKNGIKLHTLPSFTSTDNQFLCESLGISYEEFEKELEAFKYGEIENKNDFKSKSQITFINVSLAALEYFSKQYVKILAYSEQQSRRPELLNIFINNQQFMISEIASFALFDTNILYPQPSVMVTIDSYIKSVAKAIYGKELNFTVKHRDLNPAEIKQMLPAKKIKDQVRSTGKQSPAEQPPHSTTPYLFNFLKVVLCTSFSMSVIYFINFLHIEIWQSLIGLFVFIISYLLIFRARRAIELETLALTASLRKKIIEADDLIKNLHSNHGSQRNDIENHTDDSASKRLSIFGYVIHLIHEDNKLTVDIVADLKDLLNTHNDSAFILETKRFLDKHRISYELDHLKNPSYDAETR